MSPAVRWGRGGSNPSRSIVTASSDSSIGILTYPPHFSSMNPDKYVEAPGIPRGTSQTADLDVLGNNHDWLSPGLSARGQSNKVSPSGYRPNVYRKSLSSE
ncbi:MAG: hypothetical protein ACI9BV_003717 [Rhodothermales bacterium]|jgi:hypothetical protein